MFLISGGMAITMRITVLKEFIFEEKIYENIFFTFECNAEY